jgi:hypothetical protein
LLSEAARLYRTTAAHAAYGIWTGRHNLRYEPILVAKQWCGAGADDRLYQDKVPFYDTCDEVGPLGYNPTRTLYHNQQTPNADWDAFFVNRGCYVEWGVAAVGIGTPYLQHPIDRRTSATGVWVRMSGLKTALIRVKTCVPPSDDGQSNPPQPPAPPWEPPPPPSINPPSSLPASLTIKRNDYDRDGISDLVGVRNGDGCLARWRGTSAGGLTYIGDYGCGWEQYTELTAVGDITGDGRGDLVAVRRSDGCLARWKGLSGFGFSYFGDAGCGWDRYAELTGTGDFNRDGVGDLVAIRRSDGCIARWKGTSGGGLSYIGDHGCGWEQYTELTGVGDINRDGDADLVAVHRASGCIGRWAGYGTGGFTYMGAYGCGWEQYANLVGMGDINRDGVGDLVGIRRTDGCVARWRGNGNGGLDYFGDAGCGWQNYTIA